MASSKPGPMSGGMFEAGSAALRRVIGGSLAGPAAHLPNADRHSGALANDPINSIIEDEIIPRLLMAHALGDRAAADGNSKPIASSEAKRFALLPLKLEAMGLLEEVERFLEEGVSVEAIHIDLIGPAARRLGEMWESDECDFIDVTMGLWRLQEVMREIAARVPVTPQTPVPDAARVLFASMPGDQHSMGPLILDDVFARDGWDTTALPNAKRSELLDLLSSEPFDVAGLTLSRDCPSAALTNLITSMRSVSCNPKLSILVGGRMINQNPAIVAEVGADGTGADARAALEVARSLVLSAEVRAHSLR